MWQAEEDALTDTALHAVFYEWKACRTGSLPWLEVVKSTSWLAWSFLHFNRQGALSLMIHWNAIMPAGGKPPPEATDEIMQSGILTSVARNSTLFADGCKSWFAAARDVSHGGRVLHVPPLEKPVCAACNRILGTQILDRNWGHLKTVVPAQAQSQKLDDEGSHPQVYSYGVWQALWREATGHVKLLRELEQLARAA